MGKNSDAQISATENVQPKQLFFACSIYINISLFHTSLYNVHLNKTAMFIFQQQVGVETGFKILVWCITSKTV